MVLHKRIKSNVNRWIASMVASITVMTPGDEFGGMEEKLGHLYRADTARSENNYSVRLMTVFYESG